MKRKKERKFPVGLLCSAAAFCAVLFLFVNAVTGMQERAESEGAETLRRAIARAGAQCYAIEGRYPPSVDYLEENYGVRIDRDRYNVFYEGFASNLMPDITVIPVQEEP